MPKDPSSFDDLDEMRKDVDALGEALDFPPTDATPKTRKPKVSPPKSDTKRTSADKRRVVRKNQTPPRRGG